MKSNLESFNNAGSNNVKQVDTIKIVDETTHSLPRVEAPNTVVKKVIGGKVKTERYFDEKGQPYLDIDYTDHGNPKNHPKVPHEHKISTLNGIFNRDSKEK